MTFRERFDASRKARAIASHRARSDAQEIARQLLAARVQGRTDRLPLTTERAAVLAGACAL